jgi:hypothetical protein
VCVSVNHLHLHDVSMTWFEQILNKKFKGNETNFDQEISFKQKKMITSLIWNWKGWKLKAWKSSNILYCRKLHDITRNFGFCNYHLQLKFSCMRHMQLQICVVAHDIQLHATLYMQHVYTVLMYMFIHTYKSKCSCTLCATLLVATM